jgi:glutamyl-tRNA synthetase
MPDPMIPTTSSAAVRVRFAPSPTGFLHVGGARTALFNWLLARQSRGTFILRIEDTDQERSTEASVRTILDGLGWLGIDWDEGPFFQSRNVEAHRALALRFLEEKTAYRCFCTTAELETRKAAAEADGIAWKYDRLCLRLPPDVVRQRLAEGRPAVVRFRVPDGTVAWDDLVHGPTSFEAAVLEDIVLLRSNGSPTYNLSCVSDDIAMRVTHVIRGDDHISNTPKQILLYRAAGAVLPRFAHLPLILGADKKRLSKRHGAVSVTEYRDKGYLSEAMFNFLALLGWSPGEGREKMTRDEMTALFRLEDINKKGAVFDEQKLEWLNSQYINDLPPERIVALVRAGLESAGLMGPEIDDGGPRRAWFLKTIATLKARSKRLPDFVRDVRPFLTEDFEYRPEAVEKHLKGETASGGPAAIAGRMAALRAALATIDPFTEEATEKALRDLAESRHEKASDYIHPLRVALVGTAVSPGIFSVLVLVGKERALRRLDRLIDFLGSPSRQPSS